jgi:Prolyl oligopeptidase family
MSGEQHELAPPPPPEPGELGGMGPCGHMVSEGKNDGWPEQKVWVIEPTGDGAPRTGGRGDDDRRPVVFMAPGWSVFEENSPVHYYHLVENLVSNGYIVAFANYHGEGEAFLDTSDLSVYHQVDGGFVQAAEATERMDLTDVGIWGHSFGGAMVPWLAQRAVERGWGSQTFWLAIYTPYFPRGVGDHPLPIEVPDHTRALVAAYDNDVFAQYVDEAGPQIFHRLTIPTSQKRHVLIKGDVRGGDDEKLDFATSHFTPSAWPVLSHLNYYGSHRNIQAVAECARGRRSLDVDLSYLGTWSDGVPAPPAVVSDDPRPPASDG